MNGYKMWFNTGVRPWNRPGVKLMEHQEWKNGVLHIAFYLEKEPPKGYILSCLGNAPMNGELAIKVIGGGMLSKYALFVKA